MTINQTVVFSGYRAANLPQSGDETSADIIALKKWLVNDTLSCAAAAYDTFLSGLAEGIDMLAAKTVICVQNERLQARFERG